MATLTAWKFDTPDGAEQAVATLKNLASQELAWALWRPG